MKSTFLFLFICGTSLSLFAQSSGQPQTESHVQTETDEYGNLIRKDSSWSMSWSSDDGQIPDSLLQRYFSPGTLSFGFGSPDFFGADSWFTDPFSGGFNFGQLNDIMAAQQRQMQEMMRRFGMGDFYRAGPVRPAKPEQNDSRSDKKVKSTGPTTTL